ncbi:MAG: hypothetical protein KJZ87_18515 [Thermoguttaceae bacterium]|nr:hypothetical protein [Thermoguttaceae bacterium]
MDSSADWEQARFDDVFRQVRQHVRMRRLSDRKFTIEDLARLLDSEYVSQGTSCLEKSAVQHIAQAATIAAYESLLAEWQEELDRGSGV